MRATLSLVRREFSAYFLSPIAYVVFAVFLGVMGYRFNETLNQLTERGPEGVSFPFQFLLTDTWFWLVFLFIPALLTMRLLAEERGSGTLEMLLTAPLRDWQIVVSKYAACFAFYLLLWVPTLLYLPVLHAAGVDLRPAVSLYLGLALAGAMFLALGLFVSSLVRSQMVAALLSLALSLVFVIAGFWRHRRGHRHLRLPREVVLRGAAALRAQFQPRPGRHAANHSVLERDRVLSFPDGP